MSSELEEDLASRCPICLHQLRQATSVKQCGHLFCNECIHKWCSSRRQPRCPLCQAEVSVLCCEGVEEEVKPPESLTEEGPDLSCLDHAYFKQEAERLLQRANNAQMGVTRVAYGSGRRGSAAANDASSALQQVIGALQEYKHDMEAEVPFDPAAVLHELYSLESIVSSVAAGDWASAAGQQEWGAGAAAQGRLLSADDAGHDGYDSHDDCPDDYPDDEEEEGMQYSGRLSSTPGRRPTSGKQRRGSRGAGGGGGGGGGAGTPGVGGGGGGGALASRGSSGSLSAGRRR